MNMMSSLSVPGKLTNGQELQAIRAIGMRPCFLATRSVSESRCTDHDTIDENHDDRGIDDHDGDDSVGDDNDDAAATMMLNIAMMITAVMMMMMMTHWTIQSSHPANNSLPLYNFRSQAQGLLRWHWPLLAE